jgi:hypothetical protein
MAADVSAAPALRVDKDSWKLGSAPTWWRLGFDGKALLEAFVGSVVGLIALFSSYYHVNLPHRQLPLQQQWGIWLIALSLPLVFADAQLAARSRQRDAAERARERNRAAVDAVGRRPKKGRVQIEKEIALLDWMHSEIDLIEADLPSSSTPPPSNAARSSDC